MGEDAYVLQAYYESSSCDGSEPELEDPIHREDPDLAAMLLPASTGSQVHHIKDPAVRTARMVRLLRLLRARNLSLCFDTSILL